MRTGGSQRRCHSEEKSSAKFVQGDMSGAVRKLESVEGLAHQNGDTLRALKKMHPSVSETLLLPNPPDGSVLPAVATEEDVRMGILSLNSGAYGGPWYRGGGIAPSIRINRPVQRHAKR